MLQIFILKAEVKPYLGLGGIFVSRKRVFEKAENEDKEHGVEINKNADTKFLANKPHTIHQNGGGFKAIGGFCYDITPHVFIGTEAVLGWQQGPTNPYMQASFFGNITGSVGFKLPQNFQMSLNAGIEMDRFTSIAVEGLKITKESRNPTESPIGNPVPDSDDDSFGLPSPNPRAPSFGLPSPSPERRRLFGEKTIEAIGPLQTSIADKTNPLPVYTPAGIAGFTISRRIGSMWLMKLEGQLTYSFGGIPHQGQIEGAKHNLFFNLSHKRIALSVVRFL